MIRSGTPPPLSARDPSCFVFKRIPVILDSAVDYLNNNKRKIAQQYGGENVLEEIKSLSNAVSQLRNEILCNKALPNIRNSHPDAAIWNKELDYQRGNMQEVHWLDCDFLWIESYVYGRLQEARMMCPHLKNLDVFGPPKREAFFHSYKSMSKLTEYAVDVGQQLKEGSSETEIKQFFTEFLQMCLWGNKCDLSLTAGMTTHQMHCPLQQLKRLKPKLLVNDTDVAYEILKKASESKNGNGGRVDFVLDNAGFELMTDLCLADFLTNSGLASEVHFHGKAMPWFVSDVTEEDFDWTLKQMSTMNNSNVNYLQQLWKDRVQDGVWVLETHNFWTLPIEFCRMHEQSPDLYEHLSNSDLIYVKGDLNYRKLVSDLQWDTTTDFCTSLRGFHPAPICALRSMKVATVVGLEPGQEEETQDKDSDWMINGEWAVISVCDKVDKLDNY